MLGFKDSLNTLYGASKCAVKIMTKDVAKEYAALNVRANSIHPGYINTDMANSVLFLASEESAFMTGSEFVIDGGAHASGGPSG